MHFRDRQDPEHGLVVEMSGALESSSCTCLENYWERRVEGQPRLRLVLHDADAEDAAAVATLVQLIEQALHAGTSITVSGAPQLVAHSLYKIGALSHPRFRIDAPRTEEPYAG